MDCAIYLASMLLEEIIEFLKRKKLLKMHYLELLLTPKLRNLRLHQWEKDFDEISFASILQLASIRSPVKLFVY